MSLDPLLCEKHSEVSHDARYKILQLGLRKYTSALRCPSAASVAIATETKKIHFFNVMSMVIKNAVNVQTYKISVFYD